MKLANRNTGIAFSLLAGAALLLIAALTVLLTGVRDGAGASERSTRTVVLGTGTLPDPACPINCQVIASVNGFQANSPTGASPFRVPFDGRIKKFRMILGKPTSSDRTKLNDRFGGPPQAAVVVLKRVKKSDGSVKFRLLRKGPVENLGPELGTAASFTLAKPLFAPKGSIVGLAVPTWAPAFAAELDPEFNRWRASRKSGKCSTAFIDRTTPQLKVNSERPYGCAFGGSRLLYKVTIASK